MEEKDKPITKEEAFSAKAKNLFFKAWNDSVISQLIATALLILVPILLTALFQFLEVNSISEFFLTLLSIKIKLSMLLLFSILLLTGYFIYLRYQKKKTKTIKNILRTKVGNYRVGDLNNILVTTYIEAPVNVKPVLGVDQLDLLTLLRIFIPAFSTGVSHDHPGLDGFYMYYKLGPKLISYGICKLVPSLDNDSPSNINSYDIIISDDGLKFFALIESLDRIENKEHYDNQFNEMKKKAEKIK